MTAMQDGDVKIMGDYKLVLWLAGIGKQAASIPKEYQGYIDTIKPYAKRTKGFFDGIKQKMTK